MRELLDRIREALAGRPEVPYPDGAPDGRPGFAGADRATLAARFCERLDALRAPGDAEPSVLRVADAAAAAAALRAELSAVPRGEVLLPGDRIARRDYRVGVTPAMALIAETGSVVLDIPDRDAAWASLAVETHWVVASEDLLVPDLVTFYAGLAARIARGDAGRYQVCVTGSSRTADVEKIVVVPAHGPTRLRVVLTPAALPADVFASLLV